MDVKEILNGVSGHIRALKERWVEDEGPSDLTIYAGIYTDDPPVLKVVLQARTRDKALNALKIAAQGFDAVAISIAFEGWYPNKENTDNNPDTGKPWQNGEMEAYVEAHGRNGVINETLNAFVLDRDGNFAYATNPYRYEDGKVVWEVQMDHLHSPEVGEVHGYVPDRLRNIMSLPTLTELAYREEAELTARIDADLGVKYRKFRQQVLTLEKIKQYDLITNAMVMIQDGDQEESAWWQQVGILES